MKSTPTFNPLCNIICRVKLDKAINWVTWFLADGDLCLYVMAFFFRFIGFFCKVTFWQI